MSLPERALLARLFAAAVDAALPEHCLAPFMPTPGHGRTIVIGAGKASAAMARAFEQHWRGGALEGLVVTRYGHAVRCEQIEIIEAAHPLPDAAGRAAAERVLTLVSGLDADDLVVCLLSGGGSALLSLPAPAITLEDKQKIHRALLHCGAGIAEMNCVRRHLSAIKGGRLAAACHPARVLNLLISDVPGDDPENIASGPTVGDPSTCADALQIIERYAIALPPAARALLESGAGETVKPDDARLARVQTQLIATPQRALEAAARVARDAGHRPLILGDAIEGEAREVARVMAGIAQQVRRHHQPLPPPCVLLSGGETTVTVRGKGRGGRNVEFLLALALSLDGAPGIFALAADTDGIDGQEEIAGAFLAPDSLRRAREKSMRARDFLDDNDGHAFFQALGDSLVSGPTLTNVNDFRAILIAPDSTAPATGEQGDGK